MTIQTLKSELEGMLHSTNNSQIIGLNGVINRAARQLLIDVDPQETKRIVPIAPVYLEVFDYALPVDLKGNKVVDIRPQVNRLLRDQFSQTYNEDFDVNKTYPLSPTFTINFNTALKTLRLSDRYLQAGIIINGCTSLNENGTWAATAPATNLAVDNVNYVASTASLSFDLTAGAPATGYLQNSTMSAVNLTAHLNQSTLFFYVYLPVAADFSSLNLRWGSSTTDYWTQTATVTQENTVFQNGWNLIAVPWNGATVVGAPNAAAVNMLRVSYTYDGVAQTAVHLNAVASQLGTIMELEYYSKYLFRDAITGAFQETVTDDGNLINLDTESYNLLLDLTALYSVQQALGSVSGFDVQFFQNAYDKDLARYMAMYKSEIIKPKTFFYRQPLPQNQQFVGNPYNS